MRYIPVWVRTALVSQQPLAQPSDHSLPSGSSEAPQSFGSSNSSTSSTQPDAAPCPPAALDPQATKGGFNSGPQVQSKRPALDDSLPASSESNTVPKKRRKRRRIEADQALVKKGKEYPIGSEELEKLSSNSMLISYERQTSSLEHSIYGVVSQGADRSALEAEMPLQKCGEMWKNNGQKI